MDVHRAGARSAAWLRGVKVALPAASPHRLGGRTAYRKLPCRCSWDPRMGPCETLRSAPAPRSPQQALERQVDPALDEPHDRVDFVNGDRKAGGGVAAGRGAELLAGGGDPARGGDAVDAVQRTDP